MEFFYLDYWKACGIYSIHFRWKWYVNLYWNPRKSSIPSFNQIRRNSSSLTPITLVLNIDFSYRSSLFQTIIPNISTFENISFVNTWNCNITVSFINQTGKNVWKVIALRSFISHSLRILMANPPSLILQTLGV